MPLFGMGMSVPLLYGSPTHPLANQLPFDAGSLSFIDAQYHYANDFNDYAGPIAAGTAASWVATMVGAGSVGLSSTIPGGVLSLITSAAAADLINLQRTVEDFRFVPGKQSGFIASIAPGAAITSVDYLFGLAITDTSLIASAPTDGLFFTKLAASNVFDFQARKGGVSTTITPVDQQSIAINTPAIYGFIINPGGGIDVYWGTSWFNVRRVGGVAIGNANIPNTEELTLSLSLRNGTTASRTMNCDGIAYWREL